tara:strand:+ start:2423 stop:2662 length:240 start_codon:yes stop_codon:yes gene_type:complete
MNKIFDRIMKIEDELNSLIEDLLIEVENCPNNKDEIEHELIVASRAVGRVYGLNKDNFTEDSSEEENLKNFVDKGGKII